MQHLAKAGSALDRMAEGMSEVQQCPHAITVGDIRLDRAGLGGDALPNGLLAVLAMTGEEGVSMRLQPGEQRLVPDEAVLHDLGIARPKLAFVQRLQEIDVRDHQLRLMEHADEILLA
jgi:hypothetical protein